jgi:hypothetical protein
MAVNLKAYAPKDLKTEEAKLKGATALGAGMLTDMLVFERVAVYLYCCGVADRVNKVNNPTKPGDLFKNFNNAFRSKENGSGRKTLSPESIDSWASSFANFYNAGTLPAEHVEAMTARVIEEAKGGFTARGAIMKKLLKTYSEKAPTDAEFVAAITPKVTVDENPLKTWAERLLEKASDTAFVKPLPDKTENPLKGFAALSATNARQRKALLALRQAIKALITSCDAPATGMTEEEEIAAIEKATAGLVTEVPTGPTN